MPGSESFASVVDRIESPRGPSEFYSLKKLGHDVSRLPYSIRILLENAVRNSASMEEAAEAARRLVDWPKSIGSGFPFMPYRVLLQDYTGVPLIVDLAAMRDAMKRSGGDPKTVNSSVPMDLIIDHSVQVDRWGDVLAFDFNIEREYERNSERYSLLKWAQGSFRNLRVFPPGKGICHQVNLEYLSTVVALKEQGGRRIAVPDTLVGTDSHTTMVNGLGVLGWGVGGIEAEAVMLGEPYHMPIPRVVGVKIVGKLREGSTPTDIVLTVTELLRSKNVVEAFVEYFGEGYQHLSVPDRATLGNMSPEYGATVGFSPVDNSTIRYMLDTGRDPGHVKFVEEYCKRQELFAYPDAPEPKYSEVLVVDLDSIEPSIAGPRNPEERRPLASVPAFARALIEEKRRARSTVVSSASTSGQSGQALVQQGGFGHDPSGLDDGSVIIAAITSCTNTSNPTVMIGAGLIAKKAVEMGLSPKPFVKGSLAPGSTVVKDYLEGSGLLTYLDKIGFDLVGYGCTTCIAEGTPILLANGTSRPIERFSELGGASIFGPNEKLRLAIAQQTRLMNNGRRECIELVLEDGRRLTCTPDHRILRSDGEWVRADELEVREDRVILGLEGPLDVPSIDEAGYSLRAGDMVFNMETEPDRARTLAFSRLLGYLLGDGSISVGGQGRISAGQAVDREQVLNDVQMLTGLRPAANRYDERKWSIVLPTMLTKAMRALPGVHVGRRIGQPLSLPDFILEESCPVAVVREFLGGLFGADGHAPILHRWGTSEDESTIEPPAISQSTIPAYLEESRQFMSALVGLLTRCGVKAERAKVYEYPTRRSASSYPEAQDGLPRIEVRLQLPDGLSFVEQVGFRYCADKALRASAAAVYWRILDGIQRQRLWMAARLREVHAAQPSLSFARARSSVATLLDNNETDTSLPSVVSPHYALLEGYDRFSRLPKPTDRKFQPLHRDSCGFPSPVGLFREMGVREWFAPTVTAGEKEQPKRYCVGKEEMSLPSFSLKVLERRPAGERLVYDLSVDQVHAFIAGTVAVHNCIGNSGPLDPAIEAAIKQRDLYAVAVLSGNRNFDGRIHPQAKGSFLMSPMLVVAYALAGRIDFDFSKPLGTTKSGEPVLLKDLWPSLAEIKDVAQHSLSSELYRRRYADALVGDEKWVSLPGGSGDTFEWDDSSTYVREPPWFDVAAPESTRKDISGARVLALLEDKITTDHISPAGSIAVDSPAGKYLTEHGVPMVQFSTYGARRGNHEVMVRGGFANIRLRNLLAEGKEGWYTKYLPTGEIIPIYDAANRYGKDVPLIILAGKQYGSGSSRDWAAKAPKLLGVKAVIAESFERIHRSNLVAMGVIPLEFPPGQGAKSLGLKGDEVYTLAGLKDLGPGAYLDVTARSDRGEVRFRAKVRIDNRAEMEYYDSGGVLPFVFKRVRAEKT
jgi:aconitase A